MVNCLVFPWYQIPSDYPTKLQKNTEIGKCFPDCFYGKGQSLCAFLGVLTNIFYRFLHFFFAC